MTTPLVIAAVAQLGIAILNLFIVRLLHWKELLDRVPLLMREVFHVHSWFISIILTIFAVMTLRFAPEMSTNEVCRWLAAAIGLFWAFRTGLQVFYYSSAHWRGQTGRTVIHVVLLLLYGAMAVVYLLAAFAKTV